METESRIVASPAETQDVPVMAMLMRNADVREAIALGFKTPDEALERSIKQSALAFTVRSTDGLMLGMFGLVESYGFGIPWMVTSTEASKRPVTLVKTARIFVGAWSNNASLYNWVHADNSVSIDFIETLGFTLAPLATEAPGCVPGERFYLFWMGDSPCAS